ncbi:SHOCT domain-containing protein [Clostridium thailandense]|uniref:SHOCT domain-containing protein n=1 Tax=Clostridium thailandense TaxID=2794346 RepID=UPI00398A2AF5
MNNLKNLWNETTKINRWAISSVVICCLALILLNLVMKFSNTLSINTYRIINIFILLLPTFFATYLMIKESDIILKITVLFFLFLYLLSSFSLQLWILIKAEFKNSSLCFSFILFVAICIISLYLSFKSFNHKLPYILLDVLFGVIIYSFILLDGCFIAFIYYAKYSYINKSILDLFSKSDFYNIVKIVVNCMIYKFFNLPNFDAYQSINLNNSNISFNSLSQYPLYFFGKFLDIFLLGYIFFRLTSKDKKDNAVVAPKDIWLPPNNQNDLSKKDIQNANSNNHKKTGKELYAKYSPVAFKLKVRLQMLIGICIFILLILKLLSIPLPMTPILAKLNISQITSLNTLNIISKGLAYSTGFELAYMLFTDGPDEAVEPLLLAVSSFILFELSNADNLKLLNYIGILIAILIIPTLFIIKEKFLDNDIRSIEKLFNLKEKGIITEDEFNDKKKDILSYRVGAE